MTSRDQILLRAARDALRSYEYGNASPDLAKELADRITAVLAKADRAAVVGPVPTRSQVESVLALHYDRVTVCAVEDLLQILEGR